MVLILHFAVVVFIVGGLVLIMVGNSQTWHWVNALWLRLTHLTAILTVVAEAWFGIPCPLTLLESWLRAKERIAMYNGSFIEHWLQRFLYYDAPSWVFTLIYSFFGLLVVASWIVFPPTRKRRHNKLNA